MNGMLRDSAEVHDAPNFFGKPTSSILSRAPISLSTGVVAGTSDSPTCGRGNVSLSNTTADRPARAR